MQKENENKWRFQREEIGMKQEEKNIKNKRKMRVKRNKKTYKESSNECSSLFSAFQFIRSVWRANTFDSYVIWTAQ